MTEAEPTQLVFTELEIRPHPEHGLVFYTTVKRDPAQSRVEPTRPLLPTEEPGDIPDWLKEAEAKDRELRARIEDALAAVKLPSQAEDLGEDIPDWLREPEDKIRPATSTSLEEATKTEDNLTEIINLTQERAKLLPIFTQADKLNRSLGQRHDIMDILGETEKYTSDPEYQQLQTLVKQSGYESLGELSGQVAHRTEILGPMERNRAGEILFGDQYQHVYTGTSIDNHYDLNSLGEYLSEYRTLLYIHSGNVTDTHVVAARLKIDELYSSLRERLPIPPFEEFMPQWLGSQEAGPQHADATRPDIRQQLKIGDQTLAEIEQEVLTQHPDTANNPLEFAKWTSIALADKVYPESLEVLPIYANAAKRAQEENRNVHEIIEEELEELHRLQEEVKNKPLPPLKTAPASPLPTESPTPRIATPPAPWAAEPPARRTETSPIPEPKSAPLDIETLKSTIRDRLLTPPHEATIADRSLQTMLQSLLGQEFIINDKTKSPQAEAKQEKKGSWFGLNKITDAVKSVLPSIAISPTNVDLNRMDQDQGFILRVSAHVNGKPVQATANLTTPQGDSLEITEADVQGKLPPGSGTLINMWLNKDRLLKLMTDEINKDIPSDQQITVNDLQLTPTGVKLT